MNTEEVNYEEKSSGNEAKDPSGLRIEPPFLALATPRPWYQAEAANNRAALFSQSQPVAIVEGVGFPLRKGSQMEANLELIVKSVNSYEANQRRIEALEKAAEPLAYFIEQFDRKPIRTADDFYGIHTGTEWEASLRLSDLRALRAALKEEAK